MDAVAEAQLRRGASIETSAYGTGMTTTLDGCAIIVKREMDASSVSPPPQTEARHGAYADQKQREKRTELETRKNRDAGASDKPTGIGSEKSSGPVRVPAPSPTSLTNTSTNTSPSTNTATGTGTSNASSHPLPRVTVIHLPPDAQSPPASVIVRDFKVAAIRFAQDTSQSALKRESWARIAHVVDETEPDEAVALADAIVSLVGAEHADKLVCVYTRHASGSPPQAPREKKKHLFGYILFSPPSLVTHVLMTRKQLSIVEASTNIATALDESFSKQQKCLEPANTNLHSSGNIADDEDDFDVLVRRVDAHPASTKVRRVASTEACRLRRSPPQNAEHGVVRNYLEWLAALPRTPPSPGSDTFTMSDFLPTAMSQLDADHFGLDKVRRTTGNWKDIIRTVNRSDDLCSESPLAAFWAWFARTGTAKGRSHRSYYLIYHGDPAAALLEVLDPEQNVALNDHYINIPIDLSQVLFICTANTLDTIAPPLLDRARAALYRHTIHPRGERAIGGVVRFKAVEWAAHVDAWGLSPSSAPSPVSSLPSSPTVVNTTGYQREHGARAQLGQDARVRPWHHTKRAQDPLRMPDAMIDVHVHLPAGAQKKDAASAGVPMVCAIVSLLKGKCVPPTTALTGEITLRGRVSPVGGIKEKVLSAHRAGANRVILPWANRKDVEHDVAKGFVFARTVREVLDAAFGPGSLPWHAPHAHPLVESRL
ncbi:Lon protease (S16) C-terminal proteolytic domain containing protein [Russula decolorans]